MLLREIVTMNALSYTVYKDLNKELSIIGTISRLSTPRNTNTMKELTMET